MMSLLRQISPKIYFSEVVVDLLQSKKFTVEQKITALSVIR